MESAKILCTGLQKKEMTKYSNIFGPLSSRSISAGMTRI
jgi:hypothetical protein